MSTRPATPVFDLCARLGRDTASHPVREGVFTTHSSDVMERIPGRGLYSEAARLERLEWIRRRTGVLLGALQITRLDAERLTGNIENLIGAVEVPVGLAGPMLFRGNLATGELCAPFATSEGALVASATRGAAAISEAGGVVTRVVSQRMRRVPFFEFDCMEAAFAFASWIDRHIDALREQTQRVSAHALLLTAEPVILGRAVHLRLTYDTSDAAGQNMTTACAWEACRWILAHLENAGVPAPRRYLVEAQMSGDKKVHLAAFELGRGTRVLAECRIPRQVLERVLKVTPEQFVQGNAVGLAAGQHIGMVGYNINVANVVAAIFAATGQDIACVHESSVAQLHAEVDDGDLYASMLLPGLIVGTVGGGTHLPSQHALLEMLDCAGEGRSGRLAEVIAGFALALDLSTLAAVTSGDFARAHERLGRNRPVRWFTRDELNAEFLEPGLRRAHDDPGLRVLRIEPAELDTASSILTSLASRRVSRLVGFVPLRVRHTSSGEGSIGVTDVVVKVKPLDEEVMLMAHSIASLCGPRVAEAHNRYRHHTGLAGCHLRELGVYSQTDPRFVRNAPMVYRTFRDDAREAYVLVLERLPETGRGYESPGAWTRQRMDTAIRGAAELHSIWLGREAALLEQEWLGVVRGARELADATPLWEALADHAASEFPALVTPRRLELQRAMIASIPQWAFELETMPRTLAHMDFNPRNIVVRGNGAANRLCAFDWELASLHVPQRDLAELLCNVLPPTVSSVEVTRCLELHRLHLERASGLLLDPEQWRRGYALCLRELAVDRFALCLAAHTFRQYDFLETTLETLWHLIEMESAEHPVL